MSFRVKITDVVARGTTQPQRRVIETILQVMRARQKAKEPLKDTYSHYVPYLDYAGNPSSRTLVGDALAVIWQYCHDNELPLFNFLVVRAGEEIPGEAIQRYYVQKFGTLAGLDTYCSLQADLAELMLGNGCITIQ